MATTTDNLVAALRRIMPQIDRRQSQQCSHCSAGEMESCVLTEDIEAGHAALAEYDAAQGAPEWSGAQCDVAPDQCWIDDATGEHVDATTGARTATHPVPPRVAITVSSGFISVYSDKEVGVRVIDYDIDGSDPANLRTIRYSEQLDTRKALVFDHADECGIDPEWIEALFALEPSE